MIIIISTRAFVDEARLNQLLDAYDQALDNERRGQILADIYEVAGPAVRGIVGARATGRLDEDQLESLALEALRKGVEGEGRVRYQLRDAPGGDWSNDALARRDLFVTGDYKLVAGKPEVQGLLGKDVRDLGRGELTFLNAVLLHALVPQLRPPAKPATHNLIGYVSGVVAPGLVPQSVAQEEGRELDREATTALTRLRPVIQMEEQLEREGRLPEGWESLPRAERIRRLQIESIRKRYGHVLDWWHEQIKTLRPNSPFRVTGGSSWDRAKKLFAEHGVDKALWATRGSPHYLPREAAHPYGLAIISRVLSLLAEQRPVSLDQFPSGMIAAPARERALHEDVYKTAVEAIFGQPGFETELGIGRFLAEHPRPSAPEVEGFLESLPPDLAGDVRDMGLPGIARMVEQRIRDYLKEPGALAEMEARIGAETTAVTAAMRGLWLVILARTSFWLEQRDAAQFKAG